MNEQILRETIETTVGGRRETVSPVQRRLSGVSSAASRDRHSLLFRV